MADQFKKLIIVEDDELISQMYSAALQNSQFSVQVFNDGESGWNGIQATVPDIVILDFMLPKLNGLEILQKMRLNPKLQSVPVIVISSLTSELDKKRTMDAGATDYWVKNELNMVDFPSKIMQLLK